MLSARHLMRSALLAASASLAILTIAPTSSEAFEPHLAPAARVSASPSADDAGGRLDSAAAPKRLARIEVRARPSASPARVRSASGSPQVASSKASPSSAGSGASLQALLAEQIRQHPILKGTTISYGDAQGYQAISYYRSGRIVVSRSHTASLSRIVAHEVWHVIDWRDNGRIDWGENVPPR